MNVFGVQRLPKRALGGPRRLPRGTQRASKPEKGDPKIDPQFGNFWTNFGAILGSILGPKTAPKGDQNGTPLRRVSEVRRKPNQELNERGAKATGAGVILSKRKGGIRPYKVL